MVARSRGLTPLPCSALRGKWARLTAQLLAKKKPLDTMYTDSKDAIAIVQRAFPEYRHSAGKLQIKPFNGATPTSYWSGGSREYWAFVPLVDGVTVTAKIPENGSGFGPTVARIETLPFGCALVCYTIGGYKHAEIHLNAEDIAPLIAAPAEDLSREESLVLASHKFFKSTFRRKYCQEEGIDATQFETAVESLKGKGFIAAGGGLTTKGRNQFGTDQWWSIAKRYSLVAA